MTPPPRPCPPACPQRASTIRRQRWVRRPPSGVAPCGATCRATGALRALSCWPCWPRVSLVACWGATWHGVLCMLSCLPCWPRMSLLGLGLGTLGPRLGCRPAAAALLVALVRAGSRLEEVPPPLGSRAAGLLSPSALLLSPHPACVFPPHRHGIDSPPPPDPDRGPAYSRAHGDRRPGCPGGVEPHVRISLPEPSWPARRPGAPHGGHRTTAAACPPAR